MLQISKLSTSQNIVLTLTEKTTLASPFYMFFFKMVTTKEVIAFTKTYADNLSSYKERFDEFEINPSVLFANKAPGQMQYEVYESADGLVKRALLENGKASLNEIKTTVSGYQNNPTYKGYGG